MARKTKPAKRNTVKASKTKIKTTRQSAKKTAAKRPAAKKVVASKKKAAARKVVAKKIGSKKIARKPAKRVVARVAAAAAKPAGRADKLVYFFGGGSADGQAAMKNLLGGKGANLAEMAGLGLPVPPGFTITTEVCTYYGQHGKQYPAVLRREVERNMGKIEHLVDRRFGDAKRPLLVSVRSGARASMPGMMDTILNLGLNDETVQGLIQMSGSERFAYDSYRRFVQMYGDVVLGLKPESNKEADPFEEILERRKHERGVQNDIELDAEDMKYLVGAFKQRIREKLGVDFPNDPQEQLWGAISAVFGSWDNQRAVTYRKLNKIPDDWGTAVNVQAMVFGNLGNDCATGVAFTRDPSTGENAFYGEFLVNAQGEDVVAGIRTPQQITLAGSREWAAREGTSEEERASRYPSLEEAIGPCYRQLREVCARLERHYKDMQDLEFTIQSGKLWMLQTRNGKRTAKAAMKIAVDMVREKLIDKRTAVLRVQPDDLDQLLHPAIDPKAQKDLLAKGLPASPGAASGEVVFDAEDAENEAKAGKKVVLVRIETSPEDIGGMHAAQAILTARGGMTSHAAVVARGMGKCCVAGCGDLEIDYGTQEMRVKGRVIRRGDWITLDGSTGQVFAGQVPTLEPEPTAEFEEFMTWADSFRRLKVRANADTPHDASVARRFGAQGIGLCRTEHMFFQEDRIDAVREMILASDRAGRQRALDKLEPIQKSDFKGILREMEGLPVTIRLLDPPLHEFLPHGEDEIHELAQKIGVDADVLRRKRDSLHEFNPMLGHRGCRLAITFPEIYAMQVRAIASAVKELEQEGVQVEPEIMIPLVGHVRELEVLRRESEEVLAQVGARTKMPIGTMIELPRAALTADQIAKEAEFFSFGTNDLTQTAFGLSRDDAGRFLPEYVDRKILPEDPFVAIDQQGVGELMRMGTERGRRTRPNLKVGICGEHGGEPSSVIFCHQIGLDYVSCSPYRVPVARLAAAHAALGAGSGPSGTA